ncbi:DUF4386 domain-containing protein [Chloroflexota bacterium]
MDSKRKTAIIVGVLFITALVSSMQSGSFLESINEPDYLTSVSANDKQVVTGVLLMVVLTASVAAIPIMMFPILREHNESLALMYVGARIFEGFFDIILALSQLLILTLSRGFVDAAAPVAPYFQTSGALIKAVHSWSSILENFPYCAGALIFYYLLYRSRLIPRWLSGWGFLGAALFLATAPFRMFDLLPPLAVVLAVPLILNELVLAIWLIVKGFNSSAIASESVKTDTN